jgi:hypothetical protein
VQIRGGLRSPVELRVWRRADYASAFRVGVWPGPLPARRSAGGPVPGSSWQAGAGRTRLSGRTIHRRAPLRLSRVRDVCDQVNGYADPAVAPPWACKKEVTRPGTETKLRQILTSRQSWRHSPWVFLQVSMAEDARFELARACTQHAFQVGTAASGAGQEGPRPGLPVLGGARRTAPDVGE